MVRVVVEDAPFILVEVGLGVPVRVHLKPLDAVAHRAVHGALDAQAGGVVVEAELFVVVVLLCRVVRGLVMMAPPQRVTTKKNEQRCSHLGELALGVGVVCALFFVFFVFFC